MELQLFQCIGCSGLANEFIIKAEPTKEYFQRIPKLMAIQHESTTIKRTLSDDLMADKAPNGYVKVCASWMKRMWGLKLTDKNDYLNEPTKIFDKCGVYDFKNGGAVISKGSENSAWQNAQDFLEWYGVPHMDGFGLIIIDD